MDINETPDDEFDENPFEQLGDFFKVIGSSDFSGISKINPNENARRLAMSIAADGRPETNIDPVARMEYEQLARVAQLQVENKTGLLMNRGHPLVIEPLNRSLWAERSISSLEPLLSQMTDSLQEGMPDPETLKENLPSEDFLGLPEGAMEAFAEIFAAIVPQISSITTGTMVGRLATRSLGSYDLPIPRNEDHLLVIDPNISDFGKDWSLPVDGLRLWVCLHESLHHALFGVAHVNEAISDLLKRHASSFQNDPSALEQQLNEMGISPNPESLLNIGENIDPQFILGAVRSADQEELLPHLEALVAVVIGYVDYFMDEIGTGLVPNYSMITEALRRRRVETSEADRFVEKVLGLNLTQDQVDRGASFVSGVIKWGGADDLFRLWEDKRCLPTPNEVENPRLWLARTELLDT